jgi:GT2 family glycosyltransferase
VNTSVAVKNNDLIGILIVVYNRREDLFKLLLSLQRQHYPAYEILIVDNCSTDDISDVQHLPAVEYVRLEENIGFVSGMINGINRLLNKNKFRFLWVLDSDLEVAPTALERLVTVMQEQRDIGVAGCVIYNTYDRDVVVEAGADVNLGTGIVSAKFCNERLPSMDSIVDVDFIASGGGGSLFSVEALVAAGQHDERYHFLWEDTDYGLCLKKHGFRVVVVSDAVVYHPPFTEKRNPNIYAYYGVRNPLLTVAKYSSGLRMPYYLFVNLCRYLRIGLLMLFSGRKKFAQLTFRAISDYVSGRFGKADLMEINQTDTPVGEGELKGEKLVVILGLGSKNAVQSAVEFVRAGCRGEIILIVQGYRRELLAGLAVNRIITYDDRAPDLFREYWKTGMAIVHHGGCLINTDLTVVSPMCYFGYRTFDWDHCKGKLFRSRFGLLAAWRPAAAVVLAPILALFILPLVWLSSLKHKAKQPVLP